MNSINIQKEFFSSGATRNVEYRIRQLRSLYHIIQIYQDEICEALHQDLGKSRQEAYVTEIGVVLSQISHALSHLRKWAKPRRVKTSLMQLKGGGWVIPEPYGVCLILSPWNYPFQLSIAPAVAAIAAGNCVIIKPSEQAPATAELLSKIFNQNFEQRFCRVITGGAEVAKSLLMQKFDYIFFTGGVKVGQEVLQQAARNMVPCTLELGGKSPCIVDDSAVIPIAARRIVWGKTINSGQTCVAPDHLYVHKKVYKQLLEAMEGCVKEFYGEHPEQSEEYGHIVNRKHYDRICGLMKGCEILFGGEKDPEALKIAPTFLSVPSMKHPIMEEEVFGPLLPIIPYEDLDAVLEQIRERPAPIAFYLFTRDTRVENHVMRSLSFGGGCVNDTILQVAGENMPFGGVGESGMGAYHGKAGFDTFTHEKSILRSSSVLDIGLRYPPYGKNARRERVFQWISKQKH